VSSLIEKQGTFSNNVGLLLLYASSMGYTVTLGEAWRTPEQAALNAKNGTGISNSLHTRRLAIDLNLFHGEQWLLKKEDYALLARFWKSLHPHF
jgi:hypothetical protein